MYLWLGVILVLAVIEIATTSLTTVWFIVSAIVALVVSYFSDSLVLQFGIFVILGVILLITTRKHLLKGLNVKKIPTNLDRVIGLSGIVTEAIKKTDYGEVKVDGKRWTAFSDKNIKVGSTVRILDIEGLKLKVEEEK